MWKSQALTSIIREQQQMADLSKYVECCMGNELRGYLPPLAHTGNIVRWHDDIRVIETYMYDTFSRSPLGRKREWVLTDKEYFKRKLHGC